MNNFNLINPQATIIDPQTRDYLNLNGQIAQGNPLITEITTRLRTPLNTWILLPEFIASFGSKLYTLSNRRGNYTSSEVNNMVAQALQPMVQEQRISVLSLTSDTSLDYKITIYITVKDTMGEVVHFPIEYKL